MSANEIAEEEYLAYPEVHTTASLHVLTTLVVKCAVVGGWKYESSHAMVKDALIP